ncbi:MULTISPECIES: tetratricopeptide repeat protein [Rhodonellum]|nr:MULTISPECIES: tetratricopeptide repeat protein [Rhodonellum]MDO9553035.1 tetratricopeptide repeat protein [Rhodonellum sp.]SDZ36460.1 Tetratricopeptide repeat-containing protein [Rhodonellum ikkaensis]
MKKLILSLALVGFTTMAFAQKKVVKSAEKNFKKGDLEIALTEVEGATSDPETMEDPATYLLKAQIQTKMFDLDEDFAASTVEKGRQAFGTFTKTLEMVGNDANSKIGKEIYKEDLPGMPENLKPYSLMALKGSAFNKAITTYEEDDFEMAYQFFALASDIDPKDTTLNFNAGFLANDLGKTEEAKMYFNRLLEIDGYDKLNTYYFLIQIASGVDQDPEAAYEIVNKARKDYADDKTLAEFEIQLLLQLNKMDEAMASIEEALKSDPNNAGILLRYGYLKEQSGDIDGALVQYRKSVEADPEFYEGNYYTGAIYLDRARAILADVNNLSDDEWEKKSESMAKEADGLYKEAIPYFTKASELKPENTDIMEILFQIHSRLKNTADAENYNQKLTALLGENWMERER